MGGHLLVSPHHDRGDDDPVKAVDYAHDVCRRCPVACRSTTAHVRGYRHTNDGGARAVRGSTVARRCVASRIRHTLWSSATGAPGIARSTARICAHRKAAAHSSFSRTQERAEDEPDGRLVENCQRCPTSSQKTCRGEESCLNRQLSAAHACCPPQFTSVTIEARALRE